MLDDYLLFRNAVFTHLAGKFLYMKTDLPKS